MKTVLVTGCSGYIGSHLCKLLVDNNYNVHGLDVIEPKVELSKFYEVDINTLFTIPGQLDPYDAVIHLAAKVNVSESEQTPIMYYITNTNGTMNILNKIPTKNFIFASTGAAVDCNSAYGVSKRAAEDCVREYCIKYGSIPYTIFRFYNVFGSDGFAPTNPDGLMYNLNKSRETGEFTIYGTDYNTKDGTCVRDYVHINDICRAIKIAIDVPSNSVESLGHGVGHTVLEMYLKFKEINNLDIKLNKGPRRKGDLSVSVLSDVSKYMPPYEFDINSLLKLK